MNLCILIIIYLKKKSWIIKLTSRRLFRFLSRMFLIIIIIWWIRTFTIIHLFFLIAAVIWCFSHRLLIILWVINHLLSCVYFNRAMTFLIRDSRTWMRHCLIFDIIRIIISFGGIAFRNTILLLLMFSYRTLIISTHFIMSRFIWWFFILLLLLWIIWLLLVFWFLWS